MFLGQGHGIGDDHFLETALGQVLGRFWGENRVSGAAEYLGNPLLHQGFGGVDHGAAGKNFVIEGQGNFTVHVANDVEDFSPVAVAEPALFDDCQGDVQMFGHIAGPLADADVHGHHR